MKSRTMLVTVILMAVFALAQTERTVETQTNKEPHKVTLFVEYKGPDPIIKKKIEEMFGEKLSEILDFEVIRTDEKNIGRTAPMMTLLYLSRQLCAEGMITVSIEVQENRIGTTSINNYKVYLSVTFADTVTGKEVKAKSVTRKSKNLTEAQLKMNGQDYVMELVSTVAEEEFAKLACTFEMPPKPIMPLPCRNLQYMLDVLVQKMLNDEQFKKDYEEIKASLSKEQPLPLAVEYAKIDEDKWKVLIKDDVCERLRGWLRKSKLFEVKNDDITIDIEKRIEQSANSAIENDRLLECLGKHDSPSIMFRVVWTRLSGQKYKLGLSAHSLTTGKILFEDSFETSAEDAVE